MLCSSALQSGTTCVLRGSSCRSSSDDISEHARLPALNFVSELRPGAVTLRLFGGGQDYASESELTDRLLEDASNYLGLSGQPVFVKVTRHANALPQYTLGHLERIRALEQELHGIKGFEGSAG